MHEMVMLSLAGVAGAALGAMFFGGLWWTVRRGLASRYPALWFSGSLLLRLAIVLAGFYLVGGGQGNRLLACVVGFLVARLLAVRLGRPLSNPRGSCGTEARHAP